MTASPHPAAAVIPPIPGWPSIAAWRGAKGEMMTTRPSARWSARTLRIHRARNEWTSALLEAAGAKTWMSPVHPTRSRWGQSVGIDRKLARWLHTVLECNWVRRASEHANSPVGSRCDPMTTAVAASVPSSPG